MSLEQDLGNIPIVTRLWIFMTLSTTFLLKFKFLSQREIIWSDFNQVYKKFDYKRFLGGVSQTYPILPEVPPTAYFGHITACRWVIFIYLAYNFGKKVELHVFRDRSLKFLAFMVYNILVIQLLREHIWTIVKGFNKHAGKFVTLNPILFNTFKEELVVFADVLVLQIIALFSLKFPRYNFEIIPPSIAFRAKYLPFVMIFVEYIVFERTWSGVIAFISSYVFSWIGFMLLGISLN